MSTVSELTVSTQAEYDAMLAAGCTPMSPSEYTVAVAALGYRLRRDTGWAIGAYVNRSNRRHYRAFGVSYSIRAIGDTYGKAGRLVSFANMDAPRDRLPELQQLRRDVVVMSSGRVWEL